GMTGCSWIYELKSSHPAVQPPQQLRMHVRQRLLGLVVGVQQPELRQLRVVLPGKVREPRLVEQLRLIGDHDDDHQSGETAPFRGALRPCASTVRACSQDRYLCGFRSRRQRSASLVCWEARWSERGAKNHWREKRTDVYLEAIEVLQSWKT